ncbi:unnamed protein product [Caenorhabditis brenneri]
MFLNVLKTEGKRVYKGRGIPHSTSSFDSISTNSYQLIRPAYLAFNTMSRNNQTNLPLTPCCSTTSSSSSEMKSVQNYFTINISFNYATAPPQNPDLATISNLIGQQIKELVQKKKQSSRRRSSSSRRSSEKTSKEVTCTPEVRAPPRTEEKDCTNEDVTQEERETGETSEIPRMSSLKKSKYSCEYQDLTAFKKPKVRYQLVPSKNVKPVPEDELPKKKYSTDRKRREYVVLGRLNSIEPIEDKDEVMKEEERKRRSRELARELY